MIMNCEEVKIWKEAAFVCRTFSPSENEENIKTIFRPRIELRHLEYFYTKLLSAVTARMHFSALHVFFPSHSYSYDILVLLKNINLSPEAGTI
jgi:hypothetical protein